jgi:hypothetical protein
VGPFSLGNGTFDNDMVDNDMVDLVIVIPSLPFGFEVCV